MARNSALSAFDLSAEFDPWNAFIDELGKGSNDFSTGLTEVDIGKEGFILMRCVSVHRGASDTAEDG